MTGTDYCIIGCGSMGTLLALQLYRATSQPPTCITRTAEQARHIARIGLWVRDKQWFHIPVRAYPRKDAPPCRSAIITVKAWDLPTAVRDARRLGAETIFILVNGLVGERESIQQGYTPRFIVSTYGATRQETGKVELRGQGEHIIGSTTGLDTESCRLAQTLQMGGASAWCTQRIDNYRWAKTIVNAVINGLTSILWAPNRIVLERHAWTVAERVVSEAVASARCHGVELREDQVLSWVWRVAEMTGDNISSMLQDLENCRGTEADAIYKPLLEGHCTDTETIETLYMLVKTIENGGLRCRRKK